MNTGGTSDGAERAYEHVMQQRLDGVLGPGDRLDAKAIGTAAEATQTAVRDAVRRMRREGIALRQGSLTLCALPSGRCVDALEALRAIEPAAVATIPADAVDVDALAGLASRCSSIVQATVQGEDEGFTRTWRAAAFAFHEALAAGTPNTTLREMAMGLRQRLLFEDGPADPVAAARTWLFQTRILDRLYRQDMEGAAEHLRSLITWQMRFLKTPPAERPDVEPPLLV